jgi:hypothetical protein
MKSILNGFIVCLLLMQLNINVFAMPAPGYLSVPQWNSCAANQTEGTAQFWCLPKTKPGNCPASSWSALVNGNLIPKCH